MQRPRTPPYQQLADELRRQIRDGELLPGEQLPSLNKLASRHRISRATAAKAIKLLADEGLVEVIERWGVFVTQ